MPSVPSDMGRPDLGPLVEPARLVPVQRQHFGAVFEGREKELFLRFVNRNDRPLRIERPLASSMPCEGTDPFCAPSAPEVFELAPDETGFLTLRLRAPRLMEGESLRPIERIIEVRTATELRREFRLTATILVDPATNQCSPLIVDFGDLTAPSCATAIVDCQTEEDRTLNLQGQTRGGSGLEELEIEISQLPRSDNLQITLEYCAKTATSRLDARLELDTSPRTLEPIAFLGSGSGPRAIDLPSLVEVGPCPLGQTCGGRIIVGNDRDALVRLELTPIPLDAVPSEFALDEGPAGDLGEATLDWSFSPTETGRRRAFFRVEANERPPRSFLLELSGEGVP